MNVQTFVNLIEEMEDLKVQQHAELHMKASPEVAKLLANKRHSDQRRLDYVRMELIRLLSGAS